MNFTVLSSFRNATTYLDRYFKQVEGLAHALQARGDLLNVVAVYGDSTDGTPEDLFERACFSGLGVLLLESNHGGPHYGSIVHPDRFRQLAQIGNVLLRAIPPDSAAVILVESDLIWTVETMMELIDHFIHTPNAVFAPMVFHSDPADRFYDTFAFRVWGEPFTNAAPYHPALVSRGPMPIALLEVESAGSCLVMPAYVAKRVTVPEKDVIVGTCKQIRDQGFRIYVDPRAIIRHP